MRRVSAQQKLLQIYFQRRLETFSQEGDNAPRTFGFFKKESLVANPIFGEAAKVAAVTKMFDDHRSLSEQMGHVDYVSSIVQIAEAIIAAYRDSKRLFLFGNGGSAADAQHLAAEMVGTFEDRGRKPLPAFALTVNTSVLTAIANDFAYKQVFERQVDAFVAPGDVVIGISTSGNSENVILGLTRAAQRGAITVAFTGAGGGKLKGFVRHLLAVPSTSTPRIQEMHITAGHAICALVERELFSS